ncbi:MAG: hypothetical protein AAFN59_11435 [Pseudomonadota bacterium]
MRFLILALAVLAHGAQAQSVPIRSGEHPEFSRLVLEFGTLPEWTIGRTEFGFRLVTDDPRDLETSQVFEKIPATRILDVRPQPGGGNLSILIGCVCHIEAFELRDRLLVIDVRDGPAPTDNAFNAPLPERVQYVQARGEIALAPPPNTQASPQFLYPMSVSPFRGPPAPEKLSKPASPSDAFAMTVGAEAFRDALLRAPARSPSGDTILQTRPLLEPDFNSISSRQGVRQETASQTLEMLGRAAIQGLVDAPLDQLRPQGASQTDGNVQGLNEFGANISVSTAVDRANNGFAPNVSGLRGGICLSGSTIDVASWGDLDDPYSDLRVVRANVLGEFDVADFKAVRDLSRLYINMGFGAEARAVLKAFPSNDRETRLLLTLAELVDGNALSELGPLAGQLECESEVALWAALAQPFKASEIARSRNTILSTFSALPVHLRRHLGPPLMERLTEAGDTDAATSILGAVRRDGFDGDARLAMAVAALATKNGDPTPPPAPATVAGDTKLLAETVLRRMHAGINEGKLASDEDMALLPILAFELRSSQMATDLRRAEVDGYRRRGEIPQALAALSHARQTGAIDQDTAEGHFRAVALAAADSMTDASLLVFATTADERLGVGPVSVEARRALAERLIELGFANTAEQMVDDIPAGPVENRLRLARIELAREDPDQALAVLDGLDGEEADGLRARALSALAE